jgi:hypothetical protein
VWGEDINTVNSVNRNTEAVLGASRELDYEVNTEKLSASLCLIKKCRTISQFIDC